MLYHSGEIGGFVAQNIWYPKEGVAIGVLTNQEASSAAGLIASAVSSILLPSTSTTATVSDPKETVRGILEAFQKGDIDRSLFTSNANFYFSPETVGDYRSSLAPLGAIQTLTEVHTELRGGMQGRTYTATYVTKSLNISTYWMPDGKIEQFLVEGQ